MEQVPVRQESAQVEVKVKGTGLRMTCAALFLYAALSGCGSDDPVSPIEPEICVTGFACSRTPEAAAGGLTFVTMSAGGEHTCALTPAGTAFCWGSNRNGQLGSGSEAPFSNAPVQVSGGRAFASISAGALHTCALTLQGAAYCWGNGADGVLGSGLLQDTCGTAECSRVPVQVIGGHTFLALDAGLSHTCAATSLNRAYCWGSNEYGELGTGGYFAGSSLPELVAGSQQFSAVSLGDNFTCGLTLAGAVYCWGSGAFDALGSVPPDQCPTGTAGTKCSPVPSMVQSSVEFGDLSAGGHHVCGLSSSLEAYCWGDNRMGQSGASGAGQSHVPALVPVAGGVQLLQVSAAESHTCAVTILFDAFCWGNNRSGQLGTGSEEEKSHTPVLVAGDIAFDAIASGGNPITAHTCGVSAARRAFCWGARELGQVGDGK
jgi:alpha-tubulin suppressor-like RCC1 family protein